MMEQIPLDKYVSLMSTLEGRRRVTLLTEQETAARFGCAVGIIRECTKSGILPTPVRLAKDQIYYCLEELNQRFAGRTNEKAN